MGRTTEEKVMASATMVTIRPEREEDYARVAELLSMDYAEPVAVEQVREWRSQPPPERIAHRVVAVAADGSIAGYAHALRDSWMISGLFWLHVGVDASARKAGIGMRLYEEVAGFALANGASIYRAETHERSAEGLRFAQRLGFHQERHIFESTLDLATFDETPFAAKLAEAQATGIRFASLAELGDTQEARHKLHALNEEAALDVPGSDHTPRPYDAFAAQILAARWFRPEGQIAALDGEEWVGLGAVGIFDETHSAYNMFTGVRRSHRGRGIAQALKLLVIRYARQSGATYIRTNNDSENAPMLAVNRKLGYKPEPGFYRLRREARDLT